MITKIIIISHEPLTKHLGEKLFINQFIERGYILEYWKPSGYTSPSDAEYLPYIKNITTQNELKKNITKEAKKSTLFLMNQDVYLFKKIFAHIPNAKVITLDLYANVNLFTNNMVSINHEATKKSQSILSKVKAKGQNLFSKYINKLFSRKELALFTSSQEDRRLRDKNRNIQFMNHPDYDKFMKIKDDASIDALEDYILFLDIFYARHPDNIGCSGIDISHQAKEYYKSMNDFFDFLENKYNKEVIIAAHPRSDYEKNTFKGRKTVKNKTAELIKNCDFVLSHFSCAISYAVIAYKPICLLTTRGIKEYERQVGNSAMESLATVLKLNVLNIDDAKEVQSWKGPQKIDNEIREKYIYNYLTSKETENKTSFEIIDNFINTIG